MEKNNDSVPCGLQPFLAGIKSPSRREREAVSLGFHPWAKELSAPAESSFSGRGKYFQRAMKTFFLVFALGIDGIE